MISHNDSAAGTTVNAFGEDVRLIMSAILDELRIQRPLGRGSSTNPK